MSGTPRQATMAPPPPYAMSCTPSRNTQYFFMPLSAEKIAFVPAIPVPTCYYYHPLSANSCSIHTRSRSLSRSPARRPRRAHNPCMSSVQSRILWAEKISKTHDGETQILPPTSLSVPKGAKIAILGPNGSGKSTLLSILAGLSTPDQGTVTRMRGVTVAHVAQELPTFVSPNLPAFRAVLSLAAQHSSTPAVRVALRYAETVDAADTGGEAQLAKLTNAVSAMDAVPGAWEVDSFLETVLARLEVPRARKVADLSGGQKRRVAIAAALVARPDVLLLDEVTNHLSVEGIEFLEEFLQDPSLTVVAISHDRYFVDKVCTTAVWELDGELCAFSSGYDLFLQEKATRLEQKQKEVADLAKAFRREAEWMRRQPKARATKAKYREDEVRRMEQELKDRRGRLQRAEVKNLGNIGSRLGGEVVRVENVTLKRGGREVLKDFSYTFEKGERVGICGGNGVGKSSFLKALLGQIPLEKGRICVGETVVFGHFDQDGIDLSIPLSEASRALLSGKNAEEQRVIDYVTELVSSFGDVEERIVPNTGDVEARLNSQIEALSHSVAIQPRSNKGVHPLAKLHPVAMLDRFGFARNKQHTFLSRLSGGEKRRLQLMTLLLRNPNFLLLDEVSNDLDLNTLTMLEELLLQYSGVLLLCSHDRFMLDRLVDHLLVFDGEGGVELVEGKMTDYLEDRKEAVKEERKERKDDRRRGEASRTKDRKRRLSFKEKREYEGLESKIESLQERHNELTELLGGEEAGTAGYTTLAEWSEELARTEEAIENLTSRWVDLAEIAGE